MPDSLRYQAAIVGASETTELGRIPDMTAFQLHADAAVNAIKDCGIDKNQIDGIATTMSRRPWPTTWELCPAGWTTLRWVGHLS